jgi:hypothetical protein
MKIFSLLLKFLFTITLDINVNFLAYKLNYFPSLQKKEKIIKLILIFFRNIEIKKTG